MNAAPMASAIKFSIGYIQSRTTNRNSFASVLHLPDAEDRLAAASFLEYTESPNALPILLSALDHSDRQVQFAVMQSLGNLTNQHEWRPTTIDTDSHWNACIQHWREFEARLATSGK